MINIVEKVKKINSNEDFPPKKLFVFPEKLEENKKNNNLGVIL